MYLLSQLTDVIPSERDHVESWNQKGESTLEIQIQFYCPLHTLEELQQR